MVVVEEEAERDVMVLPGVSTVDDDAVDDDGSSGFWKGSVGGIPAGGGGRKSLTVILPRPLLAPRQWTLERTRFDWDEHNSPSSRPAVILGRENEEEDIPPSILLLLILVIVVISKTRSPHTQHTQLERVQGCRCSNRGVVGGCEATPIHWTGSGKGKASSSWKPTKSNP